MTPGELSYPALRERDARDPCGDLSVTAKASLWELSATSEEAQQAASSDAHEADWQLVRMTPFTSSGDCLQTRRPEELLAMNKGSQQAAPSDIAHDGQEAEQTDDKGNAIHRPELPHVGCDGLWQLQILAKDACTTSPRHESLRGVGCGHLLLSRPTRAGEGKHRLRL